MVSVGNMLSFPTPTQTHILDNRATVMAIRTQPTCIVQQIAENRFSPRFEVLPQIRIAVRL
jgi:hypothetical protein